jgi:hypothetical protein
MALITFEQLSAFPGFDGTDEADVSSLLEAASALVALAADPVELDAETLPPALIPVIVGMVRRGLHNPLGRSGEQLGDYGWQAPGAASGIYATRREEKLIRRAVGTSSAGTVTLETDVPLPWRSGYTSDDVLGSL